MDRLYTIRCSRWKLIRAALRRHPELGLDASEVVLHVPLVTFADGSRGGGVGFYGGGGGGGGDHDPAGPLGTPVNPGMKYRYTSGHDAGGQVLAMTSYISRLYGGGGAAGPVEGGAHGGPR